MKFSYDIFCLHTFFEYIKFERKSYTVIFSVFSKFSAIMIKEYVVFFSFYNKKTHILGIIFLLWVHPYNIKRKSYGVIALHNPFEYCIEINLCADEIGILQFPS